MRNWMPDAPIKEKYHFVLTRTFKVNNFVFIFNIYGILKQGNGISNYMWLWNEQMIEAIEDSHGSRRQPETHFNYWEFLFLYWIHERFDL